MSVPYTWRAREGYLPAPEPEVPLPPAAPATVTVSANYYVCVPQPQALAYAAPIIKAASCASKKEEPKPKPVSHPAPDMRSGMNYMYPPTHTKLHIFNKSWKLWEDKHTGKSFNFKIFNVATTFTPAMVIENVLSGKCEPKGWAITEVVEKGDGAWAKGTTIEHGGDRAGASLESMGWTGKRGGALPPVWVVVHKV